MKQTRPISSYMSKISSVIRPRIKSYPIYMTKPLHYSVLEYELHYLLHPNSITFTGEWYPLYLSTKVKVPEPISKTLTSYEKRHRLQLLYTALSRFDDSSFLSYLSFSFLLFLIILFYGIYLLCTKKISWTTVWFFMFLL